ncbi:YnjH family protein [Aeromonas sp.]|uniref:YnjH family protein n=1 Tax=Aeromonas sp. TaxID=647 RepID=UPI003FA57890
MIKFGLCLFAVGTVASVMAAPGQTPLSHSVGTDLVLPLGSLPERVCWYQDQKFSLGARIQQGDVWLECGPQNAQESNGPLAWREPQVYQPAAEGSSNRETISVGQ